MGLRRWQVVADLCRRHGLRHGAELGVREGRFARHILKTVDGSTVIGVDLWAARQASSEEGFETYETFPMRRYRRQALTLAADHHGRCRMIEADTVAASSLVGDASLDWIFIDADHTETAVRRDIEAWAPKLRPGGLLCGHDIDWPSVKRAVESSGSYEIADDNVWLRWPSGGFPAPRTPPRGSARRR